MKTEEMLIEAEILNNKIRQSYGLDLFCSQMPTYFFANKVVNLSQSIYQKAEKEFFEDDPSLEVLEDAIVLLKNLFRISQKLDLLENKEKMLDDFIKYNNLTYNVIP